MDVGFVFQNDYYQNDKHDAYNHKRKNIYEHDAAWKCYLNYFCEKMNYLWMINLSISKGVIFSSPCDLQVSVIIKDTLTLLSCLFHFIKTFADLMGIVIVLLQICWKGIYISKLASRGRSQCHASPLLQNSYADCSESLHTIYTDLLDKQLWWVAFSVI